MMRISNLSKSFSGQLVLNNLSLEIQKGEVVALIGSSGAGKSTFLRSLNYLEQPDSGMIAIDDFTVDFNAGSGNCLSIFYGILFTDSPYDRKLYGKI